MSTKEEATTNRVRVSAWVERSIDADLERQIAGTGLTKGGVIEEALRHWLESRGQADAA